MYPTFQMNALFDEINLPISTFEQVSFRQGSIIADVIVTFTEDVVIENVLNEINEVIDNSTLDILQNSSITGFNIESNC